VIRRGKIEKPEKAGKREKRGRKSPYIVFKEKKKEEAGKDVAFYTPKLSASARKKD